MAIGQMKRIAGCRFGVAATLAEMRKRRKVMQESVVKVN